ncbi:cysteine--tRNA ligase [Candidatus Adlerbacteria bacterium RIFCSPHIGHO2_02_FULL_52_17]|uniref:Cysteine--tRNA ligase n=1 Tax=Candidatus Adlerbacteria bacterium RIFCSPHIGHO2_02_FULL_52_17 TaxID=1797240 RepID=A0A1F4XMJ1_9BACT|nr:MAG: cysteine--tRNA ligase [Candidatus Adlerbacteria bacterium RIFCSPHIGHO2_02_FULL_52_17]
MGLFSLFSKPPAKDLPSLRLYNTISGKIEDFVPLSGRMVKMYNCGPTVYDEQHIGNLFAAILPDTLRRSLEAWGYKVQQVINITDFGHLTGDNEGDPDLGEDKMSKGLKREGLTPTLLNMRALAEKYAALYIADLYSLGVNIDKIRFPRASDYIQEQVAIIKSLEQKGYAYKTSDGIYFDTAKFKEYGALGSINLSGQREAARVEANPEKRNSRDFALWKFDKKLGWQSPWGLGFPGWHIECTAMIFTLLGKQIDIHTGGIEHIPIHHNNEIAQAQSLTGKKYAKYWLHNEHITIEGKKISKSLGNTVYLRQIVDRGYSPRALRYWVLTGHYRTPMNFTWEAIGGADQTLKRLTRHFLEAPSEHTSSSFLAEFYSSIGNDLKTAQGLALVWKHIKTLDKKTLREVDRVLGLGFSDPQAAAKLSVLTDNELPAEVQKLVAYREEARQSKDFAKADELRGIIENSGYSIKDSDKGPMLTKK